jgi:hypothetical protein
MEKNKNYEPPESMDLSDLTVNGGGVHPMGICTIGSFPWDGCVQGSAFAIPSSCNPGTTPNSGNLCYAGTTPDTGTSQCYPHGSVAGNTCEAGNYA